MNEDNAPKDDGSTPVIIKVNIPSTISVPALEKLVDYTASGIGAIAGPMLVQWKAEQEGKARLIEDIYKTESLKIVAKAKADARQILIEPNGTEKTTLAIGSSGDFEQRIEFQEKKRQANIRAVVWGAATDLYGKNVPDHEPDPDWTARFFDCVQDVSSEDMQKLWAKLLAGEVEGPGRTSLRTLDILRNLTKEEAQMFQKICDLVLNGESIFCPIERRPDSRFFFYHDVLHLETIGLARTGSGYDEDFGKLNQDGRMTFRYQNYYLAISKNDASSKIKFPLLMLSASGQELYKAMEHNNFRMDYLRFFSSYLNKRNLKLSHARIKEMLSDGSVRHGPLVPIEPESDQTRTDTP